jgi:hypothetical protein
MRELARACYLAGLRAFLTLSDHERNLLTFDKFTVAITLNFAMMHEYIRGTFTLNEPETPLGIKPFYDASCTFVRHWGRFLSHLNWFDVVGTELLWGTKNPTH